MATKGKRPMRALTPSDKIEAIQRVNDGESKASVARDIGVPESTLRGWCKNEDKLRYMTSRVSSSDTDKSNDGDPPDKRPRTESPAVLAPRSPVAGLDLTTAPAPQPAHHTPAPLDAPVELTTKRAEPSPPCHSRTRERRPDPDASVSMSAISPLTGLSNIPGLTHSHLGLSFNDITELSLLAHFNPGLTALSAQCVSRALRSVRSPKPAHNGLHGLSESKHRSKSHHSASYRTSGKSSHYPHSTVNRSSDETLWQWQQAILNLSAQTTASHSLQLSNADSSHLPKPVAPVPPGGPLLNYNRNWLWQNYKNFSEAMPPPEYIPKSASKVPKEKAPENILYSQLTKGKADEERTTMSPAQSTPRIQSEEAREPSLNQERVAEPAASPEIENKEPLVQKTRESSRTQTKARTVLDNLLFNNINNNNNNSRFKESAGAGAEGSHGEWGTGAAEALAHGEKFLAWLEASGDPAVTRVHVHQLRALLLNLRARRATPALPEPHEHARRK